MAPREKNSGLPMPWGSPSLAHHATKLEHTVTGAGGTWCPNRRLASASGNEPSLRCAQHWVVGVQNKAKTFSVSAVSSHLVWHCACEHDTLTVFALDRKAREHEKFALCTCSPVLLTRLTCVWHVASSTYSCMGCARLTCFHVGQVVDESSTGLQ